MLLVRGKASEKMRVAMAVPAYQMERAMGFEPTASCLGRVYVNASYVVVEIRVFAGFEVLRTTLIRYIFSGVWEWPS